MISTLKITDGDMIFVHLEGASGTISAHHTERIREKLLKWAKAKGLNNVDFLVTGGDHKLNIAKLTVNDVFEDEILKGENNG